MQELRLEPTVAARVELRLSVRVALLVPLVSRVPLPISFVGSPETAVGHLDERLFHRPDVPRREPPVGPQRSEVQGPVPVDATGEIDKRVDVRVDELPDRAEEGLAAVETRIPRSRDGAEPGTPTKEEDHVVQIILRFQVDDDRRVAMLLGGCPPAQGAPRAINLFRPTAPRK